MLACQLAGKMSYKMCLFLQGNVISSMTFVAAADMSAGLVIVTMHMLICPAF